MKFIGLTMLSGKIVLLNPDMIGDIFEDGGGMEYGKEKPKYTSVGHLTHNNGGFKVKETPEQILKLIKASKDI